MVIEAGGKVCLNEAPDAWRGEVTEITSFGLSKVLWAWMSGAVRTVCLPPVTLRPRAILRREW